MLNMDYTYVVMKEKDVKQCNFFNRLAYIGFTRRSPRREIVMLKNVSQVFYKLSVFTFGTTVMLVLIINYFSFEE